MQINKAPKVIKLTSSKIYSIPNKSVVNINKIVTSMNAYKTDRMIDNLASLLKK
jgi:hypothetical protein